MPIKKKYKCPCCGFNTLEDESPGTFDICSMCFWEDDPIQYENPDYEGGANDISLNIARKNYKETGAISKEHLDSVKQPQKNKK